MTNIYLPAHVRGASFTRRHLVILVLISGAFVLRLYKIDHLSLWIDETGSVWFAQHPFLELWTNIPRYESNPPLYYTLLKLWLSIFGTGESAARSLSVMFGVLTVPVVYWLGVNVGGTRNGHWVGTIAALAVALSPVQIEYSQEARPYAAQVLGFALALAGLAHLLRFPADARRPWLGTEVFHEELERTAEHPWAVRAWSALIVGTATTLWMHYTAAIYVAALALALLPYIIVTLRSDRDFLRNVLLAAAVVATLCIPYLYYLSLQFQKVSSSFWIPALTWETFGFSLHHLFGLPALFRWQPIPNFLLALLAAAGFAKLLMERRWRIALMLTLALVIPIIALVILSDIYRPIFLSRLVLGVTVPYYLAVAVGITWLSSSWLRTIATTVLTAIWLVSAMNFYTLHSKEPWRDVVKYVADGIRQNDIVIIVGGSTGIPFEYYRDRQPVPMHVRVVPAKYPAGGKGTQSFSAEHLPDLIATLDRYDRAWLIMRRADLKDPHGLVRSTLEQRFAVGPHRNFGYTIEVRLYQ